MTRKGMSVVGLALIAGFAALWLWTLLPALGSDPLDASAARTIPLGPPQASFPTSAPASYHAFPADILLQTRAALIAQNPLSRPAVEPQRQ